MIPAVFLIIVDVVMETRVGPDENIEGYSEDDVPESNSGSEHHEEVMKLFSL